MKRFTILITFFLFSINVFSQKNINFINKKAKCLNKKIEVSKLFMNYNIIMVGEIHGTNEPSILVKEISNAILLNDDKVAIGIEAKASEFQKFINKPSRETLKECKFFTRKSTDGRNSIAWFNLILSSELNDSIDIFFFDIEDYSRYKKRDSLMAVNILEVYNKDTNRKIITLSGNLHNRILPAFDNMISSYNYLSKVKKLKLCSIGLKFYQGTAMVNMGKGLEKRIFKPRNSIFSDSKLKCSYLVFNNKPIKERIYNFYFYTKNISISNLVKEE